MQKRGQPIDCLSMANETDWGHDQPGYFLNTAQRTRIFVRIAAFLDEMSRRSSEVPRPELVAPNMLSAVDTANHALPVLLAAVQDPDADIEIRIAPPFADAPFRMWRGGGRSNPGADRARPV